MWGRDGGYKQRAGFGIGTSGGGEVGGKLRVINYKCVKIMIAFEYYMKNTVNNLHIFLLTAIVKVCATQEFL